MLLRLALMRLSVDASVLHAGRVPRPAGLQLVLTLLTVKGVQGGLWRLEVAVVAVMAATAS